MSTLTDRYIAATLVGVPENQRDDVENELRASIADAIDAQIDGGADASAAERQVLTDLGDPARLSASYAERPLYLIGPALFLDYRRVLIALLSIVVPIVAVVVFVINTLAVGDGALIDAFVASILASLNTFLHIGFWVTLSFAIVERSPQSARAKISEWSLDRLPSADAPDRRSDTIGAVVFIGIFIAALIWQQFAAVVVIDGAPVREPVLNPQLWTLWLPLLIVILVAQAVLALVTYRAPRSWGYAAVKFGLELAQGLVVIGLAATGQLLNPAFFEAIGSPTSWEAGSIVNLIVIAATVIVTVWAGIDDAIKAYRSNKTRSLRVTTSAY